MPTAPARILMRNTLTESSFSNSAKAFVRFARLIVPVGKGGDRVFIDVHRVFVGVHRVRCK